MLVLNALGATYALVKAVEFRYDNLAKPGPVKSVMMVDLRVRVILSQIITDKILHFDPNTTRESLIEAREKAASDKAALMEVSLNVIR